VSGVSVGTAYFKVNHVQYALAGDMKISTLERKHEALVGMDGSVAPQVQFQSPMIECTIRDRADVDLTALQSIEGATVTVELANGTTWELSQAFYTGDGELDAAEGGFQVRFNGQRIRRIAA
jgi:Phage tail tube protein